MPDGYTEIILVGIEAREYWCRDCEQLRLAPDGKTDVCGNCGGTDLLVGAVNTLDAEALRAGARA